MDIEKSTKIYSKYSCAICTYNTRKKTDYMKHLTTAKHIKNMNDSKKSINDNESSTNIDKRFDCICGKQYMHNTGYYRHKKNCNYVPEKIQTPTVETQEPQTIQSTTETSQQSTETETNWIEMMQMLMKENKEIRNFMVTQHNTIVEQNKTLTDVVKTLKPANNSYNTTTNNNQSYTINMFLNEKCKDALNFSKFIEELKTKVDMLKIYENGYVDGISKLFIDGLSSMEVTERPLHCTDERRNTFYVHDNDEWNKDENLKDTKKAIFHISQENLKQCMEWSNDIPDNVDPDEHITQSIKLCKVAGSGDEKNTEKIIKNISKEIPLNKQLMNEL